MTPGTTPAGAPDATGRRIAKLPAALLGNGSLLATLSARGELERMFWPHVDHGQHLGELRIGIVVDGHTRWLDDDGWEHEQSMEPDASVLRTVARGYGREVEIVDLVHPVAPAFLRRIRCEGDFRLVVYCRPDLDESRFGSAAYVDRGRLACYRRDRAFAVGLSRSGDAACGRSRRGEEYSALDDALDGHLDGDLVAHRGTEGALVADAVDELVLAVGFAESPQWSLVEVDAVLGLPFEQHLDERRAHDRARVARAAEPVAGRALYRRSLLVLDALTDRASGASIAAPELDPGFVDSGGYGFVWGRDLAFGALASLTAGRGDDAAAALRWLARNQEPEGLWLQRHFTTGELGPSWCLHQLDETGAILFAYEAAWEALGDVRLDRDLWRSARAAADFLCSFVDPATHLPRPSVDLWEQRKGQHSYTAAAVAGGLAAAAQMARRHDPATAWHYEQAAQAVRDAIEEHLWSEEHNRYLRTRATPVSLVDTRLPYPNRRLREDVPEDATIDISLLGLAWPFGAVDPAGERMRATAEAVERALVRADGGVLRYEGDTYAGGNAWVLATLWLGLWKRQVGDEDGWRRAVEWTEARQTRLGLLPEQVNLDGSPGWVLPLAWSHAMLLLAARPELGAICRSADRVATAA